MVSFISLSFMEGLTPIFIFLLIFAVVYGVLVGTKIFGSSNNLNAIIAFVLGVLFMLSGKLVKVIIIMIPWILAVVLFIVLIVILFKVLGVSDESIIRAAHDSTVYWVLIILGIIIFVGALASVYGQQELAVTNPQAASVNATATQFVFSANANDGGTVVDNTNTPDYAHNVKAAIYSPQVLGFALIIIIAALAATQLTKK